MAEFVSMLRAGIQLSRIEWDGDQYSREQSVLKMKESCAPQRLDRDRNAPRLMLPWYFITVGAVKNCVNHTLVCLAMTCAVFQDFQFSVADHGQ